eukprot:TRINITY_DN14425_c1_g1_i1.p1 TRINITY_DN14425_c1_g1~~TRINITY_DN14425_c1_g1_i1.p1  ORF type:complete len:110 (-),score=8.06 TRINITY_DN14425_c1_g1_i1:3-332(-)
MSAAIVRQRHTKQAAEIGIAAEHDFLDAIPPHQGSVEGTLWRSLAHEQCTTQKKPLGMSKSKVSTPEASSASLLPNALPPHQRSVEGTLWRSRADEQCATLRQPPGMIK